MLKRLIPFLMALATLPLTAAELVRDGQPQAEIIVSDKPLSSVKTAAQELQKYIKKMSGAELPIVTKATGKTQIYVGTSEYTDKLGIKLDDIKYDGFKIIAKDNYVALLGVDQQRLPIPRDNVKYGMYNEVQKRWEEDVGHKWEYPAARDPRYFSHQLGFNNQDATGTLYAVYDFLESLGMRWFMPIEEIGVVVPELKDINVPPMELKKEPRFASRHFALCGIGNNPTEFLWFKSLKTGGMFDQAPMHSSMFVADLQPDNSELLVFSAGKRIHIGGGRYLPRLASLRLREEVAEYLIKVGDAFPELTSMPIGQPDGWTILDDRDVAAGWNKTGEGDWGKFSDYTWDFVLDVAARVHKQRPNARFNTMSYGYNKKPPKSIDKIPADIAIYLTQTSQNWQIPGADELALREEWYKKAPDNDFFIYDYYLAHAPYRNSPPVPVIFPTLMEKNFQSLDERCKGLYTELAWNGSSKRKLAVGLPGINHLMLYLHCKLSWDKNLDVKAALADYYDKFYGPAKEEMREFFEYSEKIWMRPEARQITAFSGFLKPADVPKYFEILARAKAKAGDSVYGKRIDLIAEELAPLNKLFSELKRTGPYVRMRKMEIPTEVDGDLTKPFWTEHFPAERSWLKDLNTGCSPDINMTSAAFRWLPDSSLLIGITCYERRMDSLRANTPGTAKNDAAIYNDDSVEVHLETPEGYNAVIVVNPNGSVRATCTSPNVTDVPGAWDGADKVAVRKLADRWTVEINVKGLGSMPTKAYPWGIHVFRQRLAGGDNEAYALSPTGTGKFLGAATKMGNLYGP